MMWILLVALFVGSGTTCSVARRLGRNSIGIDLSYSYLHDLARHRLGFDKLDEWEQGREEVEIDLNDLPLFG